MANAKFNIEDFVYGGKYHSYFWDDRYNPNATIANALANCTTLSIGMTYVQKLPYPVTKIVSAANFHKVLTNGWKCADYGSVELKVGDIVQWVDHCHVATVVAISNGKAILGCSWYTGIHGKSVWNGSWDTRKGLNSLPEVSDFFSNKYPYRFYHEADVDTESDGVGGKPEHVLIAPSTVTPVDEDKNRDQIKVLTDEQNVRNGELDIVGVAAAGYYNVYSMMNADGYTWYEVEEDRYIAGVSGRVVFIPAQDDDEIDRLIKENEELKAEVDKCHKKLEEINRISKSE